MLTHKIAEYVPKKFLSLFLTDIYTVADIYSIIAYYLRNKSKVDKYLAKRENEAEKIWKTLEKDKNYQARVNDKRNNDSDSNDAFDASPIKAFLSFKTASNTKLRENMREKILISKLAKSC